MAAARLADMNHTAAVPAPTIRRLRDAATELLSTPQGWVAAAVVLVLAAVGQAVLGADDDVDDYALAALGMAAPVAFVNRFPRLAAMVAVVAAMVSEGEGSPFLVGAVVGLTLVCGAAAYHLSWPYAVAIGAPFLANAISPFDGSDPGAASFLLLVLVAAALGYGALLRSRNAVVAERDATVEAHAETQRQRALLEERTRIARELHDVVAHHISGIAVQAETARYTTPDLPPLAAERFAAIGDSARSTLDEMRRLLGVMREFSDASSLSPQPGLAELNVLIDEARSLGATVRFTVRGEAVQLPADVGLVAYRVVQEALTNARRHAAGSSVEVSVDYTPTLVRVRVRDHGPGAADGSAGGFGLIGMRERVETVGGTLAHGDHADGGYEVIAELPVPATP
jgi:signal transduction histidine kinase